MKTHSLILILLLGYSVSFAQTETKIEDLATVKYRLCEYLLSCQAMSSTILNENNYEMKQYLSSKGFDSYDKAYKYYLKLKDLQYEELSHDFKENISTMLDVYAKIFRDNALVTATTEELLKTVVALTFMENIYKKKILPELWKTK